jgi:hypothetical protein
LPPPAAKRSRAWTGTAFLLALDLSKSFGHDLAFALGLFFLGFIFYPILAFGGDTYQGPAAAG